MAIVPTLALTNPQTRLVGGQSTTVMLTVSNTGGSSQKISSISTYVTPAGSPSICSALALPPETSLTIASGGSASFPFSVTLFGGPSGSSGNASAAGIYQINALVYSDDASTGVAPATPITVAVTPPYSFTQTEIPTSPGWLDYGQPANSGLDAVLPL